MVPLLTLGIPGNSTTAIMMGAFIMYGIVPGPMLFQERPELVWGLIDSMYLGNLMLLLLNLPLVGVFARLLYTPPGILLPLILVVSSVGVFTVNGSVIDLWLALGFGVVGYLFRKADIPVAPLVLALVLGKTMEQSFRQSMTISGSDPAIFVHGLLSTTLLAMAVVSLTLPLLVPMLARLWRRRATASEVTRVV
jgi:putative tricarboxylic transport membrane protein